MGLSGGRLEVLCLGGGQIAPQPHQAVLTLGGIADGRILGIVLGFEHLYTDAGQVGSRLTEGNFTIGKALGTTLLLLLQLLQTLIGYGKLCGRILAW